MIKRIFTLVVLLFFLAPTGVGATPISTQELKGLQWPYFDNSDLSGSCTPADDLGDVADMGSNVKTAYVYLAENGYSPAQAAGLVGNFMAESTYQLDPTIENGIGAYGIAQWLGGRLTAMRSWVRAQGMDPASLEGQLKFVVHELNTTENAAKTDLLTQKTPDDAAESVFAKYERPGDDSLPARQNNARLVYSKYAELSPNDESALPATSSSASDGSNPCANSQSPDCLSATGTAKILCEAKKYEGIYYRWGGGHQGYDSFIAGCPNPSSPPNNQPSGSASDPTNGGVSGNPSPCATDCSSLVSIALDTAFNKRFMWTVSTLQSDGGNWKSISKSDIQPGDVLTKGDYHVEIVDHYGGNGGVTTLGSHETGTKTGYITTNLSDWSGAYRYIGPQE